MTRLRHLRSETGDRRFVELAAEDPFGPRFERALVERADLLLIRYVEAEAVLRSETIEWSLYAGEELLAERSVSGRGAERSG
jgi:hypothetical protein